MAVFEETGTTWRRRIWRTLTNATRRVHEFIGGCLHLLLVPLLVTVDALCVVLWYVSSAVQRRLLRQQRTPLGPCRDLTVEHVDVAGIRCPLCPYALKYRSAFPVRILCGNSELAAGGHGEKVCVCARDHFMPAIFRWALGCLLLLSIWVAVVAGGSWGIWRGRFILGFVQRAQSQHLPAINDRATNIPELEKKKAVDIVRGARGYLESKRYSAARIEYRNAIQRDPSFIEAYTGLAECCLQLGFFGEAKEALGKVLELDPSSPTAYRRLTELAGRQRDFQQAIIHARKLCELQPKDTEAHLLLGNCYVVSGDITNALREVSLAMSLNPSDPDPYVAAAYVELLQKHTDIAEQHYLAAIRMSSTNIAARIGLAGIYLNAGKMDDAIKSLNSALEVCPASVDAILALGKLHCVRGASAEAVALYRKKTNINPQLFVVRAELADLLIQTGRASEGYDTAIKLNEDDPGNVSAALILSSLFLDRDLLTLAEDYARKALRSNPNVIEGHKQLVRIYVKSGDVDKTLSYLKRIAPALPDDLEIQLRFAICQEMKGESEKAEQTLKTLSGRYPESSLPYLHLGELHTRHKKIDMAIANYRQAAARKPENPDVLNNLASLLLDNRKDDSAAAEEAFRLATRAWEMAPENPASADTLGWANCRKGSYDQAMMLLSFAQRRVPSSPEVRYHLAYALRGKGRLDEARSQLEAALAISSTFAGADAARAMLEELKK